MQQYLFFLIFQDIGIPLTDSIGLNIGICVPNQCENEDVEAITVKSKI